MSNIVSYIMLGAVVIAMFVFMLLQGRKQKKAQEDYMGMLDSLRPGVKVKMASGLLGRIKDIHEIAPGFKTVTLNIGEGKNTVEMSFVIEAVQGIVNEEAINRLNIEKMEAEDKAAKTEAVQEAKKEPKAEVKEEAKEAKQEKVAKTEKAKPAKTSTKKSTKKSK